MNDKEGPLLLPVLLLQMRMALPALAAACDRHGVFDRAAASLATAVLRDMQIISLSNPRQVIDQSKVRRECHKQREDLTSDTTITLPGLYFYDRKNKTLVHEKMADGKFHEQIITKEHISIVFEQGSTYSTHVSLTLTWRDPGVKSRVPL